MTHLVFVEYGISKSQLYSCIKRGVKIKFIRTKEMCDIIPVYLDNYNKTWDSINIICNSDCDKQQSSLTFLGETVTTSPLIEEYDKNRNKIMSVLNKIYEYTDYIYIYTNLKMYSATLKKICIDAYYKTTYPNTAVYKDIFVSTNASTKDNMNMSADWSVINGFLKKSEDNQVYILHAKNQLFNTSPSNILR